MDNFLGKLQIFAKGALNIYIPAVDSLIIKFLTLSSFPFLFSSSILVKWVVHAWMVAKSFLP